MFTAGWNNEPEAAQMLPTVLLAIALIATCEYQTRPPRAANYSPFFFSSREALLLKINSLKRNKEVLQDRDTDECLHLGIKMRN